MLVLRFFFCIKMDQTNFSLVHDTTPRSHTKYLRAVTNFPVTFSNGILFLQRSFHYEFQDFCHCAAVLGVIFFRNCHRLAQLGLPWLRWFSSIHPAKSISTYLHSTMCILVGCVCHSSLMYMPCKVTLEARGVIGRLGEFLRSHC
jgi:hypothetical protein